MRYLISYNVLCQHCHIHRLKCYLSSFFYSTPPPPPPSPPAVSLLCVSCCQLFTPSFPSIQVLSTSCMAHGAAALSTPILQCRYSDCLASPPPAISKTHLKSGLGAHGRELVSTTQDTAVPIPRIRDTGIRVRER